MTDWTTFFPPRTKVMALPTWRSPRLFIVAQNPLQRWRRSALYPAFRARARLFRLLLRLGAAASALSTRTTPSAQGWSLGAFVQEALPEAVSVSVLIGWPGPTQKTTVQCWNERGEVIGYLKYAERPAAQMRLERERQVLGQLAPGIGPEMLKYGSWQQGKALLVAPLSGEDLAPTLPPHETIVDFTQRLSKDAECVAFQDHPWYQRWEEAATLKPCIEALAGQAWPVVVQHGDLAPWNLRRSAAGHLRAFDWEYGTLQGFPYLDLAHYTLKVAALIKRWSPSKATDYTASYLANKFPERLSLRETYALVRLSAYDTYYEEARNGHDPQNRWQRWRYEVWQQEL